MESSGLQAAVRSGEAAFLAGRPDRWQRTARGIGRSGRYEPSK
jgi:hypothetical protein